MIKRAEAQSFSWPLFVKVFSVCGVLIFGLSTIYGYIKIESMTQLHRSQFEFEKVCKAEEIVQYKYARILRYDVYKKSSLILCVYSETQLNQKVTLYLRDQRWEVVERKSFTDPGVVQWPLYL